MTNHSLHHNRSTTPNDNRSDRGLVSVTLLIWSGVSLLFTLSGAVRLAYDVFILDSEEGVVIKVLALTLGYSMGIIVALLGMRVFHNLILPLILRFYAWLSLIFTTVVYILIMIKLYSQAYSPERYLAYAIVMMAGVGAVAGFHVIIEKHNLRPLSIPLLLVSMFQLVSIIYRYVFTLDASSSYFLADMVFFLWMLLVGIAMLGQFGIFNFVRRGIDRTLGKLNGGN